MSYNEASDVFGKLIRDSETNQLVFKARNPNEEGVQFYPLSDDIKINNRSVNNHYSNDLALAVDGSFFATISDDTVMQLHSLHSHNREHEGVRLATDSQRADL